MTRLQPGPLESRVALLTLDQKIFYIFVCIISCTALLINILTLIYIGGGGVNLHPPGSSFATAQKWLALDC